MGSLNFSVLYYGFQIIENCPVTKIITGKSEYGYKQVEGVATPHGEIKTKCVVNASGLS